MLDWAKLVIDERFTIAQTGLKSPQKTSERFSNLQRDVSLIVNTTAFRRLQGKAQLFIAPESDFVRNRLTHTLEAVTIARTLASLILGDLNLDDSQFKSCQVQPDGSPIRKRDMVEAIAAACYMHDIGNTPFGHVAEDAISDWFSNKKFFIAKTRTTHPALATILEDNNLQHEFTNFDGNAQGFRIVTCLNGWRTDGGLQLTYVTLASAIKYAWIPAKASASKPSKYGCFLTESTIFDTIFSKLGLKTASGDYNRHPFSFIVEAADDIAYRASDTEDGYKLRLIPFENCVAALTAIASERLKTHSARYEEVVENVGLSKIPQSDQIKYLKASAVDALIQACRKTFAERKADIMNGTLKGSLIDNCELKEQFQNAKKLTPQFIYNSKFMAQNDQGAFHLIQFLLDEFSVAVEDFIRTKGKATKKSQKTLANIHRIYDSENNLRPEDPRVIFLREISNVEHYHRMLDTIAGMTDMHAIRLSNVLRGSKIGTR